MTEAAHGASTGAIAPQYPPTLLTMALESEAQGLFAQAGIAVLFTGLGKVNAAIALTRRLTQYRLAGRALPTVLNFGTAGSRRFPTGTVLGCDRFVQRDMDVTALGFERGVTPFESLPAQLQFAPLFPELPSAVCGSGDCFETGAASLACDVIDMEAYALAKVCQLEQARFGCAKYITDGADHGAASDWHSNLPAAAAAFIRLYRQLAGP